MNSDFDKDFVISLIKDSIRSSKSEKPHRITRLYMYKSIKDRLVKFETTNDITLSVSNSISLANILGLNKGKIHNTTYPEVSILDLPYGDGEFSFCVSDHVLEHVEGNPFRAFHESVRVIKPGGWVCHTTYFINPLHGSPKDFWRFTEDALALMARESGCDSIETGSWGQSQGVGSSGFGFSTRETAR